MVRSHHERWDGSGYPSGLVGEEISSFARIAAVADVFDAVTSERFHAAVPRHEGVELIRAGIGQRVRPGRRRGLPRRVRALVEQVERRADDRLGVDLVVAVDVVEIA